MLKPFFETDLGKLYHSDCLEVVKQLPDNHVQCVVTSPPYWGLRDYGTAIWEGGDGGCDHIKNVGNVSKSSTLRNDGREHLGPYDGEKAKKIPYPYTDICKKCGAKRIDKQIGLEKTPREYVEKLVTVFRGVRRVLKDNGILWLNLGDSYAGSGGAHAQNHANPGLSDSFNRSGVPHFGNLGIPQRYLAPDGMKPKDLVGIPWTVALALRADGWYLRRDNIWHKPNPCPDPVKDRCTTAHEYLFHFSKSERYYYDIDAIREPLKPKTYTTFGISHRPQGNDSLGKVKSDNWGKTVLIRQPKLNPAGEIAGANKRSVWTVPTYPFPEAHFATFPPALIEPCILAGSAKGDIIFDPFMGAGTTAIVAEKWNRQWIGIELNQEYCEIAKKRIIRETRQLTIC